MKGYRKKGLRLLFRGDAAFGKPEVYEYLEQETIGYTIRVSAIAVLQREIAHLLVRPTEWPSPKPIVAYHDFVYQAQSWDVSRRVVAKMEWHQGELFPRVGFIVTNLNYPPKGIVRFYNGQGTAEQWIKEGKYALNWTPAFLPLVRGQQGEAGTLRTGLQHGQLLEKTGLARGDEALVVDQSANQSDRDRRAVGEHDFTANYQSGECC